jgi:hypothetical protein
VDGRFRYSGLKEAAPGDYGICFSKATGDELKKRNKGGGEWLTPLVQLRRRISCRQCWPHDILAALKTRPGRHDESPTSSRLLHFRISLSYDSAFEARSRLVDRPHERLKLEAEAKLDRSRIVGLAADHAK